MGLLMPAIGSRKTNRKTNGARVKGAPLHASDFSFEERPVDG
jgi:hypothetical protein